MLTKSEVDLLEYLVKTAEEWHSGMCTDPPDETDRQYLRDFKKGHRIIAKLREDLNTRGRKPKA